MNEELKSPIPGLPAEHELLICCARTRLEETHARRVTELLQGVIDWDGLFSTADCHRVTGLLTAHIAKNSSGLLSPSILDRLTALSNNIARRNLALTGELCRIIELFKAQGITAIPYKGPVLALRAYGNLALRQSVDLDVFVRRKDILSAKQILLNEGYRPIHDILQNQEATIFRSEYALEFIHPQTRVQFELHWDIARTYFSFPLEPLALWDRLEEVSLGGMRIPSPSWVDTLLLVSAHSSKHCWNRLIWICDVAELLREAPPGRLAEALARARELGGLRMLLLGLSLAHRLLNAELPHDVMLQIERDRAIDALATRAIAGLFKENNHPSSLFEQVRFHLGVRERLQDRLRYCVRAVGTPTIVDVTSLPLPRGLTSAYLLARPVRLLKKHLRRSRPIIFFFWLLTASFLAQCAPPPPPPPMDPKQPTEVVEPPPPKEDPDQAHRPRSICPPGMVGSC